MTLQYGQVWQYLPDFLLGALTALWIAAVAFAGGLLIGLVGAAVLSFGPRAARIPVIAYVRFFTYTPQLVQIFFLFFALPEMGIILSPVAAVLIGMTLNAGAYLTEIERAGFESVPRAELDAAETLGFSRAQTVWYVIAPHVVRALYPALSSHYIIMTLGTSMAAIFGVEELTGRALNANAISFRSVEIFSIVAVIYIALTVIASALLWLVGRWLFRVKAKVF
ncbi:amino acid ABC transporter permease [Falsiroseomonas stagni]|uniref:Amino acid ABC transporter membrane protein 1, PAAT family n=1 Tax=Falsiroseomonas stagni DSM 19981 TaxID=1123062 RepID=A0A1I4C429_9PROT|nr:amino acid ABC transporter permease [Falsiroseomonas stagni]SFK74881.1 amino acid ABC transporter membrane protein 1, PAAT family [Falsiroseomonas stagni DSM 19981]